MSRKDPADVFVALIFDIVISMIRLMWMAALALWAVTVPLFFLFFKSAQLSPENQLLRLQPNYAWLKQIEPKGCSQCGAINESQVKNCYRCGATWVVPAKDPIAKIVGNIRLFLSEQGSVPIVIFVGLLFTLGCLAWLTFGFFVIYVLG